MEYWTENKFFQIISEQIEREIDDFVDCMFFCMYEIQFTQGKSTQNVTKIINSLFCGICKMSFLGTQRDNNRSLKQFSITF